MLHEMGINYNDENELFKKGSILVSAESNDATVWASKNSEEEKHLRKRDIAVKHCDIISPNAKFWLDRPLILKSLKECKKAKKIKLSNSMYM